MNTETVEIQVALMNEMADAFVKGGDTLGEAVNVIEQIITAIESDEVTEADLEEIVRVSRRSVLPMLQNVRLHFGSLQQKAETYGQAASTAQFRPGEMMQTLANGEETVQGTIELLGALSEGLKDGELTGSDASTIERSCRETHVPALQSLHKNFGELQQTLAAMDGATEADAGLKGRVADLFARGQSTVGQAANFLDDIATKIAKQELSGPDGEALEGALRSALIPALRAVAERMSGLQQETLATV